MKGKSETAATADISAQKRKQRIIAGIATVLLIAVVLAIVLPITLRSKADEWFTAPAIDLPTEEMYALQKYDYESLADTQVTLRADTMNVTQRNLARPTPQMLTDDFSIVYNTSNQTLRHEYSIWPESETEKVASIHFDPDHYPAPGRPGGKTVFAKHAYEMFGIDESTATAEEKEDAQYKYLYYYKYMLLTQGQYLAVEAQNRSKNGTLTQEWLTKHPAADLQYGAVLGENNAVEKEITIDPLYRSYHATGLYLPAGEAVTVRVEGLNEKKGEKISVFVGLQNSLAWRGDVRYAEAEIAAITDGFQNVKYANPGSDTFFNKADIVAAAGNFFEYNNASRHDFMQSQYERQNNRAPWVTAEFVFDHNGEYTIGTHFGGVMHINPRNSYSQVKTTFRGAVETPHYILGVTTPQYFEQYLKDAPGVVGVIDTENGQLVGPTGEMGTKSYMRGIKTDEVDKLAMLWHSFFAVNESFTGGTYNRHNLVMFDWHVPAGAAVALGNYVYACPTGWFSDATNYRRLLNGGTWGTLHEIGHNHASSNGTFWGFGDGKEGEVHNNALTTLGYLMFCDIGTQRNENGVPAEHGFVAHPYFSLLHSINLTQRPYTDYSQFDYFDMLSMYSNIMHSFGPEKFYELLYSYKDKSSYAEEGGNQRSEFAYRCSLIYGMDFRTYFNTVYKANITDNMFSAEQLAEMSALPTYHPIACYYAGGIDGVKTGGDYRVAYGSPVVMDLLGKTISTTTFEIVSVGKPKHGSIRPLGEGKYEYTFNPEYTGTFDDFDFLVKLSDGVIHKLNVSLRISYNGAKITSYKGVAQVRGEQMWASAESEIAKLEPVVTAALGANIAAYNSGKDWEVRVAEYYWRAPKSGSVRISAASDDALRVYFGDSFETATQILELNSYNTGFNDSKSATVTVEEGRFYAVRLFNLNTGGQGSAQIAIKYDGEETYVSIANDQVFHPDVSQESEIENYIYEPKYIVSKKDNVKLSITGTDKRVWQVVRAPENIEGGRYAIEQMQIKDDDGNVVEVREMKTDKWSYLVDGSTGTILHTAWRGNLPKITPEQPHEFVVDTGAVQSFNFISVVTRNNVNSYITDYDMYISETLDNWGAPIASGNRDSYKGTMITEKFTTVQGRYIRIVVKGTTGGTFSVLAEIDGGIQSQTQRVVPSTSPKLFATKHWQNSGEISSEPSGYLVTSRKNQKVVVKFKGDSFALYAASGEGYGSFKVKLDGKQVATVSLNGATEARKLVYNVEELQDKEHTVEIITTDSGKVMLNVLGISYTSELLGASNIYLERGLAISLTVFILLFAAVLAVLISLIFAPKFRKAMFSNRLIEKLDNRPKREKKSKAGKKAKDETAADVEPDASAKAKPAAKKSEVAEKSADAPKATAKTEPAPKKEEAVKKPVSEPKATAKAESAPKKAEPAKKSATESKATAKAEPAPKKAEPAKKPAAEPKASAKSAAKPVAAPKKTSAATPKTKK